MARVWSPHKNLNTRVSGAQKEQKTYKTHQNSMGFESYYLTLGVSEVNILLPWGTGPGWWGPNPKNGEQ